VSHTLTKIISGGQTGVDRGALEAGLKLGIEIGGYCPKGRLAEDGTISDKYPMVELTTKTYPPRTKRNIAESDGTLILVRGKMGQGTKLTVKTAMSTGKPLMAVDITSQNPNNGELMKWINELGIKVLNVAGSREKSDPGIQKASEEWLIAALS
jgi:hypothetical protein